MNATIRFIRWAGLICVMGACLWACGNRDADPETAVVESPEIAWFKGSVQEAFAEAKATERPVFLFWSAAWCPYCQQLKSSVFTRRDFIEKSRLFVPVYLDGDDPGAQKWGETLKVSGYPTVLILRPDGTELMRIAGGMDVERYTGILDLALSDTRPVAQILATLDTSKEKLSADDCRRLAYHGFVLETAAVEYTRLANLMWQAAERCPEALSVERARLQVQSVALDIKQPVTDRVKAIVELLGNTDLSVAVADTLFTLDDSFFVAARSAAVVPEEELRDRWFRVMDAAAMDPRYSESDQFFALTNKLNGAKVFGALTPEMIANARARVAASLARQHDAYTRASVVNSILYVMDTLDDQDELYRIAEQEMQTAATPYYLMPDLAAIDEKHGRTDSALGWLERAYNESRGPATRFQWGTSYVAGLIRMHPQDEAKIRATALSVLNELDGPDRLYQRTNTRIARLEKLLEEWNADGSRVATIKAVQARMQDLCMKIPETEAAERKSCAGFLS